MAGIILERYIKVQALLSIARDLAIEAKTIVDKTTIDKEIKKQINLITKESLRLDSLISKRMIKVRKEFHDACEDFDFDSF